MSVKASALEESGRFRLLLGLGRKGAIKTSQVNKMSVGLPTTYASLLHFLESFRNVIYSSLSSLVRFINEQERLITIRLKF